MKIGMLLRMLNNNLTALCNRDMEEFDLTVPQSYIMGYLMFNEGREVNQRDIEMEFRLMNPTVTGILKRLEKKGFIVRMKSKADARYNIVELTERGREIPGTMNKKAMEMEKRLLSGLSEAEIELFTNTLRRMIDNISNEA